MRHIKSIISKRLRKLNSNEINDKDVLIKLVEILKQKSIENVDMLFCKNKIAYVACENPIIANELYLIQEGIKDEINKFLTKGF